MLRILSRNVIKLFSTSSIKGYQKYINQHIKKSLQSVSTPGKIKSKQTCETYFQKISQTLSHPSSTQSPLQQSMIKTSLNMIFSACFQLQNFDQHREIICQMILDQKIKTQSELDRVLKFLLKEIKWNSKIGLKEIENFVEQLERKTVEFSKEIQKDLEENEKEFSQGNVNALCKRYRQKFPQVDSKMIFDQVNNIVKRRKNSQKSQNNPQQLTQSKKQPNTTTVIQQNKFWDKIQNIKPRLIKQELNDPQIYEQHIKITQNKLRFRFPPQPNGYLHIGHVKSIRMNFQSAKRLGGQCFLRYDDTNPEKQSQEYIDEIEKNVRWLGYSPDKVNFTSDYFQQMMHFANHLVKEDKAYVCESSQQQIQLQRKQKRPSPYREKQRQFSQKIFPHLSPTQTLRLKLDPSSSNPTLRDPIIYRHKSHPHPKTGTKFSIYPMYDFAHCISDSLQHIDYSLCSLEFQIRRELYYKILDLLGLYKPIVWEFSRLNVKGNVISKRKIKQLIDQQKIEGWDDPRLLTIKAMQRRGYTPHMLHQFVDKVNSSRSGNEKFVRSQVLEREMKKELTKNATKVMALKQPFKVNLLNSTVQANSTDQQKMLQQNCIYVQKQEIQKLGDTKELILKNAGVFQVTKTDNDVSFKASSKSIQEVKRKKQKLPIVSWLSSNLIQKKVVFFESLLDENEEFNPNSRKQEIVFLDGSIQKQFQGESNQGRIFLFERIGYFKKDEKTGELICCAQV